MSIFEKFCNEIDTTYAILSIEARNRLKAMLEQAMREAYSRRLTPGNEDGWKPVTETWPPYDTAVLTPYETVVIRERGDDGDHWHTDNSIEVGQPEMAFLIPAAPNGGIRRVPY